MFEYGWPDIFKKDVESPNAQLTNLQDKVR